MGVHAYLQDCEQGYVPMTAKQHERRPSPALLATEPDLAVLASRDIHPSQNRPARPENGWMDSDDCQHGSQHACMWDILGELDEPDEPCPICSPTCRQTRSLVGSRHTPYLFLPE